MRLLAIIVVMLGFIACSVIDKLDGEVEVKRDVVILQDGQQVVYGPMSEATFKVQIRASVPVSVTWVGANCLEISNTLSYQTTCKPLELGQLTITNPSTFGLGASSSVSIVITQLLGE